MAPKRRSSVLTNRQREYLLGDHKPANESEYRERIRDGLHMSVFDYYLILKEFPMDDIRKALQDDMKTPEDADAEEVEDGEFRPDVLNKFGTALPSLFGLPYIRLYEEEKKAENQNLGWRMETYIESGLQRALNRMRESVNHVSVDIDIDTGEPLDELADRELTELNHNTLQQLRKAGRISDDEFAEAWVALKERQEE